MVYPTAYLRLAEKSVGQLSWQLGACLRSAQSQTVKPIKSITVTTSLTSMLSFKTAASSRRSTDADASIIPLGGELLN
jgi:hypothetical protein